MMHPDSLWTGSQLAMAVQEMSGACFDSDEHNADPDTKRKARTANTSCLECAAQNGNGGPCCFSYLVALVRH